MWIRRALGMMLMVLAVGAANVAFTTPALAHTTHHASAATVKVTGGKTVLVLDSGTAGVLTANGVKVAPISGAFASGKGIAFPITGGKVTTKAVGTINHRGGLKFTAGKVSLGVQDFVIDTTKGVLTARVSGTKTRIPLLDLDLGGASIKAGKGKLTVKNVHATLTKDAAAALNKTFGVKLFTAGLPIGTATVKGRF